MSRNIVRVLKIPAGKETDEKGRKFGDDWMLADMGVAPDGTRYWVTTDSIHASEYGAFPIFQSDNLAEFLTEKINAAWKRHMKKRAKATSKES